MHEVAALDRAQDDLDWQQIEAIKVCISSALKAVFHLWLCFLKGADEKLQSKYETAKQVLEENGEQVRKFFVVGCLSLIFFSDPISLS